MMHNLGRQSFQSVAIIGLKLSTDMQICPGERKCSDTLALLVFVCTYFR